MVFIHEHNIDYKANTSKAYKKYKSELLEFKERYYIPYREKMLGYDYKDDYELFIEVAKTIDDYRKEVQRFALQYEISAQSKFESTFLEEVNVYLFSKLEPIVNGTYEIFNDVGIYKDLKITDGLKALVVTKNVDFCIGKKAKLALKEGANEKSNEDLIIPAVCVETKTYLDSTMLGEVTTSSKMIKLANPDAHTYVFAGYKAMDNVHLLVAEKEAGLDDIFFIQEGEGASIDPRALYAWWLEVKGVLTESIIERTYDVPGRMFKRLSEYKRLVEEHPLK